MLWVGLDGSLLPKWVFWTALADLGASGCLALVPCGMCCLDLAWFSLLSSCTFRTRPFTKVVLQGWEPALMGGIPGSPQLVLERVLRAWFALANFGLLNENAN